MFKLKQIIKRIKMVFGLGKEEKYRRYTSACIDAYGMYPATIARILNSSINSKSTDLLYFVRGFSDACLGYFQVKHFDHKGHFKECLEMFNNIIIDSAIFLNDDTKALVAEIFDIKMED